MKDGETQGVDAGELGRRSGLATAGNALAGLGFNGLVERIDNSEYAELRRLVMEKGLLDKQPTYFTGKILLTLGMLAISLTLLVVVDNLWLHLLNAAFLAFVFTQIGFIAHDAGHRQIFRDPKRADALGYAIVLLLGLSWSWWVDRHNRHHGSPNLLELDPDVSISVLAFAPVQVDSKRGLLRFMVKYQAFLFFPLLCLQAVSYRLASVIFLARGKAKHSLMELLFLIAHLGVYSGLLLSLLGLWQALLFILVHQALFGLYNGSIFASNHKGMLVSDSESRLDFLRQQVITARNVKANRFIDLWYGGLHYQIEHHLFPNMARSKLGEAQKIVKAFCQAHDIAYHETGMVQSFREILQYLHQVSTPLRRAIP